MVKIERDLNSNAVIYNVETPIPFENKEVLANRLKLILEENPEVLLHFNNSNLKFSISHYCTKENLIEILDFYERHEKFS